MRVAAVVVTFNRPKLLARCLAALRDQSSPPAAILIFDNGSAGPHPVAADPDASTLVYACPGNVGSGGGFHFGMKEAFRLGYDAVWMLDDDGLPAPDALAAMLRAVAGGLRAGNCLVVDESDPERLAFPGTGKIRVVDLAARADANGVVRGHLNFFNGTLVTRAAYEIAGDIKFECFIWGDEVAYQQRIVATIPEAGTVMAARHAHPANRQSYVDVGPFKGVTAAVPPRLFVVARNIGFNRRRRIGRLFRNLAAYALYGTRAHGMLIGLKTAAYYVDGAFDTFWLTPSRRDLRARLAAVTRVS